jgi:hypothetical protein
MLSPWVLGYSGPGTWFSAVIGMFVVIFAVESLLVPSSLEELAEIVLGIALVAAPLVREYPAPAAATNSMVSGAAVIVFAVWELLTDESFRRQRQV